MGDAGLERKTVSACDGNGLRNSSSGGAAESDALSADAESLPPELARLVEVWHDLPAAVRQTITGLVEMHSPEGGNG